MIGIGIFAIAALISGWFAWSTWKDGGVIDMLLSVGGWTVCLFCVYGVASQVIVALHAGT